MKQMLTWIDEVLQDYVEPVRYVVSVVIEYGELNLIKVWNEVLICSAISETVALEECLKLVRKKIPNKKFRVVSKMAKELEEK